VDQSECRGGCCERGGDGPSRGRVSRRHRRLPDSEPDAQDILHSGADHGRRTGRRAGVLRAVHDRLQQQVTRRAPGCSGSDPLVLLDGLRRAPAIFGGHGNQRLLRTAGVELAELGEAILQQQGRRRAHH